MRFTFQSTDTNFTCQMQCTRCKCNTKSGARCRRRSCIGTGYCWAHLISHRHLRIKASLEPGAGKGVFVMDKTQGDHAVIFKPRDLVIEYDGEKVVEAVVDQRYGQWTAPYTVQNTEREDLFEDAACHRGVGAIVNQSKTRPNVKFVSTGEGDAVHVALFAVRNIKNNAELLVNYNGSYALDDPTQHHTR